MSTNKTSRFRILDSLRGLAAVLVVIHHFMVFNETKLFGVINDRLYSFLQYLSSLNHLAVLFFFVLSGFSIGYSLKGNLLTNKGQTNTYLYKRFKRIIPIYLLALLFSLIVGLLIKNVHQPSYSITNLVGNLLFLQTAVEATPYWFSPYGKNGPLWSLSFEMFFYLFLPFFSYLIIKIRLYARIRIWILLVCLTVVSILINKYVIFIPLLSFLSLFAIWWMGFEVAIDRFKKPKHTINWALFLFLGLAIQMFKDFVPSATVIELGQGFLMGVVLYLLFRLNDLWSSPLKALGKKIFNFFFEQAGHGSYALYALHYPLFVYMNDLAIDTSLQIFFTFVLMICCIMIEKWTAKQSFSFFRLNYLCINTSKVG